MITIISGTNRQDSNTTRICNHYLSALESQTKEQVNLIDLSTLPIQAFADRDYNGKEKNGLLSQIQDDVIIPTKKFIFIIPEYNGGMPGILKLFIDQISARNIKESFYMKKACLTGVSSGRAGNLRGMEHLTGVLNYLNVIVFPNRLPISGIENLISEHGKLEDDLTIDLINEQVRMFLTF